jgi:hypothetical protein
VQEDVNMRDILEIIASELGDYVICGSLAFQLQGIEPLQSVKDIDVIVDTKWAPSTWKVHMKKRFTGLGWSKQINGNWIDVYSKPLPEYDIINVDGLYVKVKSVKALISHYRSLDLEEIGGHVRFQNKLRERKAFVQSL